MKFLPIIYLSLIYQILSTPPLPDPEPLSVFQEYSLNDFLLQGPSNFLTITKGTLNSTLFLNSELSTLTLTLRAINLPEGYTINNYSLGLKKKGQVKILNLSSNKNEVKYNINGTRFIFHNLNLKNNEEVIISIRYQITDPSLFNLFHKVALGLPPNNRDYQGEIYISYSNDVDLFGSSSYLFKSVNNGKYYWSGNVPMKGIFDVMTVGTKSAKWMASDEGIIKRTNPIRLFQSTFQVSLIFQGGNNKIKYYKVSSNIANKIDGKNIIKSKSTLYFHNKGNPGFYRIITEFSNKVSSNWYIEFKNYNYKSTATKLTKEKAKEILSRDLSNDPPFIKLGKWVKRNIKYDISYGGKQMSIEEILTKRIGVCDHFAQLYNALLHSINIPAVFVGGYAFNNENSFKNPKFSRHAWSLIKINSKWIPIDPTWGLFEGKLPVSHVFETYFRFLVGWRSNDKNSRPVFNKKIQFKGIGY